MTKSESITELAKAFSKFKAEHPKVTLDEQVEVATKKGGKYYFKFASLPQVKEKVDPFLNSNGLAVSQLIDGSSLTTILMHSSGDYLEASMDLNQLKAVDEHGQYINSGPQEFGALVTYARRYAYCAILNIIGDGADENGKKAPAKTQQPAENNSTYQKAAADQRVEADKPWLNRNTPQWDEAARYITDYSKGDPSLSVLLEKFKISKEVRTALDEIKANYFLPKNINHISPALRSKVNMAINEDALMEIYNAYITLQHSKEFTDLLGKKRAALKMPANAIA